MGYSTSFNLTVSQLKGKKQQEPVTIDSIISELSSDNEIDRTNLISKLKAAQTQGLIPVSEDEVIKNFRKSCDGAKYALSEDGTCADSCKWYSYDSDLIQFSKKYPDWLFTLSGEGEESGDIWKMYVVNGKAQRAKAKIVFDEFNPKKLK